MQIAATDPKFVRKANAPSEILEQERKKYRTQAATTRKPAQVIEKIVDGKVAKSYEEPCLYEQPFVKDQSISISTLLVSKSRALGEKLAIRRLARCKLGDSDVTVASDSGWQSEEGDEAGVMSPKRVPPKSGSGSAAAGSGGMIPLQSISQFDQQAREKQVKVRVIPTGQAINESVDLAHEIFNRVFRKVPERMNGR